MILHLHKYSEPLLNNSFEAPVITASGLLGLWCYKLGTPVFGEFLPFFPADPLKRMGGEPSPQYEVLSALEQIFIKDLCTLLCSSFPRSFSLSAEKHPHSMMLTPPCFTVGMVLGFLIYRCVPFQVMSNQINLPQFDSNQVVETSQGWSMETGCNLSSIWSVIAKGLSVIAKGLFILQSAVKERHLI
jgi:hypothetical protein